ncbi:uncharacterized protein LOC127259060 [Andrographis paniculata]|uniref:uncharacterized protein LOC127259060 n=1 Tax=Andrographis paniculata TaxID=175694 RepID=UPI0021E6F6D7|nr:uncharacterized protein LOC127259060 [Andrographis paniculata]
MVMDVVGTKFETHKNEEESTLEDKTIYETHQLILDAIHARIEARRPAQQREVDPIHPTGGSAPNAPSIGNTRIQITDDSKKSETAKKKRRWDEPDVVPESSHRRRSRSFFETTNKMENLNANEENCINGLGDLEASVSIDRSSYSSDGRTPRPLGVEQYIQQLETELKLAKDGLQRMDDRMTRIMQHQERMFDTNLAIMEEIRRIEAHLDRRGPDGDVRAPPIT